MRTTILLPDELYAEVRRTAGAEGRTITSVIEEAVRSSLREREAAAHRPYRLRPLGGSGVRPGVDLDDNSAVLDLMDGLESPDASDADART